MTFDERIDRLTERHEALAESVSLLMESQRKTENVLRRAIRLGVREARNERKRRQEMDARFDEKIGQLASAQLITETKVSKLSDKVDKLSDTVDRFIESLHRTGNGHSL